MTEALANQRRRIASRYAGASIEARGGFAKFDEILRTLDAESLIASLQPAFPFLDGRPVTRSERLGLEFLERGPRCAPGQETECNCDYNPHNPSLAPCAQFTPTPHVLLLQRSSNRRCSSQKCGSLVPLGQRCEKGNTRITEDLESPEHVVGIKQRFD